MPRPPHSERAHSLFGAVAGHEPRHHLVAYIDGGARGNPGPAGFGVLLQDESGHEVARLSEFLGTQTNNYAEYSALLGVLTYAVNHGPKAMKVFSDSELLVKQIRGEYKVSSPALKELYRRAKSLIDLLDYFDIRHVLREKNRVADHLANLAMDRGAGRSVNSNQVTEREVNGRVENGVVEFLGPPLPNGTLVKVRAVRPPKP